MKTLEEKCAACLGSGRQACSACGGSGEQRAPQLGFRDDKQEMEACAWCSGTGQQECLSCGASGYLLDLHSPQALEAFRYLSDGLGDGPDRERSRRDNTSGVVVAGAAPVEGRAPSQLTVFTLGTEHVYRDGRALTMTDWTYHKARELLFYLSSYSSRSKEQIGLALWPDASGTQLRSNFRVVLHHLRRALGGPEWILFENGSYRLNRSLPCWMDCEAFESRVIAARQALESDQAIQWLLEALALYRGDFLASLAGDWPMLRREELRRLHLGALLLLGKLFSAVSRYAEAEEIYRRALAEDSYLEAAHRGVMRSLGYLGERGQALRHYDELVALLQADMGSPPDQKTVALVQRLRQDTEV